MRTAQLEARSILANVTCDDVRHLPFPHVVIRDCLPAPYFQALASAYPRNETILDYCKTHPHRRFNFIDGEAKPNDRFDVSAFQALEHPGPMPEVWLEFIRYHTSRKFFLEVLDVFGEAIRLAYPWLERKLGKPLESLSTGVRFRSDCDISLDCQVGINTPSKSMSSVRRVHTDAGVELFAALLYFRARDDDTPGGDLELLRWKNPRRKRFIGSEADESATELVDTVPYAPNTMVLFLNTQDALHAVTDRAPSPHTRRLVNIIGEVDKSIPRGLFSRPKRKDLDYFRRKLTRLGSRVKG